MECRISVDHHGLFFISPLHLLQKFKVLSKSDIKVQKGRSVMRLMQVKYYSE